MSPSSAPDAALAALDEPLSADGEGLRIDLDGYEGPLHALLDLARQQRVDLARLSMTELADQFLAFVEEAQGRQIDLAAQFLVMAAWLAWLKSRLLLPKPERPKDEPDPEAESARLKARLAKLTAAKRASEQLARLPQLGWDVWLNGAPQPIAAGPDAGYTASLADLLRAYCQRRSQALLRRHRLAQRSVYPVAAARKSLEALAPQLHEWTDLDAIAPRAEAGGPTRASTMASTLGAALELIRDGKLEARQAKPFDAVYLRARRREEAV